MVHYAHIGKVKRQQTAVESSARPSAKGADLPQLAVRGYRPVLLLFIVFFIMMFNADIRVDRQSVFEVVRSIVWEGDVQLADDRVSWSGFLFSDEGRTTLDTTARTSTGYSPVGVGFSAAMTYVPAMLIGRGLEHAFFSATEPPPGFSLVNRLLFTMTSVFLGILSILLMTATCRLFGTPFSSTISVIGLCFSSAFIGAVFLSPALPFVSGLFWTSLFFYLVMHLYTIQVEKHRLFLWLSGFSLGMAIGSMWALLPLLILSFLIARRGTNLVSSIRQMQFSLLLFFFGLLIGLAPQLLMNKLVNGSFFSGLAGNASGEQLSLLFHPRLGLFYQSPLVFFGLLGILFLFKIDRKLFLLLLCVCSFGLLTTSVIDSSTDFIVGHAGILPLLPLLTAGATLTADRFLARRRTTPIMLIAFAFLAILWSLLQYGVVQRMALDIITTMQSGRYMGQILLEPVRNIEILMSGGFFREYLLWTSSAGLKGTFMTAGMLVLAVCLFLLIEWLFHRNRGQFAALFCLFAVAIVALTTTGLLLSAATAMLERRDYRPQSCQQWSGPLMTRVNPRQLLSGGNLILYPGLSDGPDAEADIDASTQEDTTEPLEQPDMIMCDGPVLFADALEQSLTRIDVAFAAPEAENAVLDIILLSGPDHEERFRCHVRDGAFFVEPPLNVTPISQRKNTMVLSITDSRLKNLKEFRFEQPTSSPPTFVDPRQSIGLTGVAVFPGDEGDRHDE